MHNRDDRYPTRPGFEPGTSRLHVPVDMNEPSGPAVGLLKCPDFNVIFYREKQYIFPKSQLMQILSLTSSYRVKQALHLCIKLPGRVPLAAKGLKNITFMYPVGWRDSQWVENKYNLFSIQNSDL